MQSPAILKAAKAMTPAIHPNGSGAESLVKQWAAFADAIRMLKESVPNIHGRDYYVKGETAIPEVVAQLTVWQGYVDELTAVTNLVREAIDSDHAS